MKLVVYVDDFVAGGKDDARAAAWVELRELFDMGEPEPIRKFLGIDIISKTDGAKRLLTFSQEAFARSILEEYKQDLGMETTKKFRHVTTPGLDAFPDIESPFSSGRYASKAARYVGKHDILHEVRGLTSRRLLGGFHDLFPNGGAFMMRSCTVLLHMKLRRILVFS